MLRKRIYTILLSFLVITLIGGGYSAFLFHNSKSKASANGNYRWDNIRANYIFNDGYDYEALPQKKYNIYFMAQSGFNPKESSNKEGEYDLYFKSTVTNNNLNLDFGQFDDGSYYKVLRNVTEISMFDLHEEIGYPHTNVTDRSNMPGTNHGWPLYFNGWSLNYDIGNYDGLYTSNNYLRATGSFPHGTKSVSFMRFGISIQRYLTQLETDYPELYKDFSIFSRSSNVDDIFLFPVYTSGKDYVASDSRSRNDPIQIRYNSEDTLNETNYKEVYLNEGQALNEGYSDFVEKYDSIANNNTEVNSSLNTLKNNVKVYSKNAFNIDGFKNMKFMYDNGELGWNGWRDLEPIDGCSANFFEENEKSKLNHPLGNGLHIDGVGKGVFTVYAFKKEGTTDNTFTGPEIKFLNDFLRQRHVTIYYSVATKSITKSNYGVTKVNSFYIAFEKFYEPRLVGGPSGSWNYANDKNYAFRRAVSNPNMFALENVEFTKNDETSWHNELGMKFSNLIFNVSLNDPVKFFAEKKYGEEKAEIVFESVGLVNYEMYNYAHYFSNINTAMKNANFDLNEYIKRADGSAVSSYNEMLDAYLSYDHVHKSLENAFVINPARDDVDINSPEKSLGYGVYSLALNLKYSDNYYKDLEDNKNNSSFGPFYPTSVDVYAYRETNIFTVIYSSQSDYNLDLMTGDNSRFLKPSLVGTNINYAFIAKSVFLDTPVGLNDIFIATEKAPSGFYADKEYTLEQILKYYKDNGKKVIDSVTEFVFNEENLMNIGFRTKKNYALVAV